MDKRWISPLMLSCCLVGSAVVSAQEPAAPNVEASKAQAPQPAPSMDEVKINAQREKLVELRKEMVKAEDRFYAAYNKLNTDHRFDVTCNVETRTGTLISARACRPAFVNDATAEEATEWLDGHSPPPAIMKIQDMYPQFEKNMLQVINASPGLRKAVRERETLGKRYEELRRQKFKDRVFLFE